MFLFGGSDARRLYPRTSLLVHIQKISTYEVSTYKKTKLCKCTF